MADPSYVSGPYVDADGAERGGDGRYDIYVCDLASQNVGELAATVSDPPGSYIVVDDDYSAPEVAPLPTTGVAQLRVTVAHELFHAIQMGEGQGRLPEWIAESTAVWMEGIVSPPDVDREIYRVALGGAGTEEPYWRSGDLHEYGAWWLVQALEHGHTGFVRRLLALAATNGDPRGLDLLVRALGGRQALEAAFAHFARTALDDPLVGKALRARRTGMLGPGDRIALSGSVEPLSLRLWRVPSTAASITLRRAGGLHLAVVVRRGAVDRTLGTAALHLRSGSGPLLVLVIGGGGGTQSVRITASAR